MINRQTLGSINLKTRTLAIFLSLLLASMGCNQPISEQKTYDLVIYGATSAGIAAAIQAVRMEHTVILISPEARIGGLTTGGLGQTDIGNKVAIGGISREFYERVKTWYDQPEHWKWQKKEEYQDGGQTRTAENENSMWTFEPSAALAIYEAWLKEEQVEVVLNEKLNRETGVGTEDGAIRSITMLSGKTYTGKEFIDATYEGDLMAAAGVSYRVGREANSAYHETLNGVHPQITDTTMTGRVSHDAYNHNFVDGVDPYVVAGDPSSGLLPYINPDGPGVPG
ncbi:MAG: FAD-dependent oxidoreductase, partial [Saprospiraceae bacterium]|nr:FAD-dependent oxidoreductase [Saprospiraceae bacterium]